MSWLPALVHLIRIGGNPDHARAAATWAMLEFLWDPTLPGSALWPNRTCRPCRSS